jgi:hypothetical protein
MFERGHNEHSGVYWFLINKTADMQYTKIKLLFFLFLSSLVTPLSAVDVQKGIYEREKNSRPGIRIYLNIDVDAVKDAYEGFLRKNYDFKLKGNGLFTNKDELYAKRIMVEEIIDKQLNWYAQIIPAPRNDHKTQMTIFVSLGYDIYLNEQKYPEAFQKVYDLNIDFLEQFVPEYHEEQIEATTDQVKDLEKDTNDLEKDIRKSNKRIEKLKAEIRKMEATREERLAELDQQRERLQNLQEAFRQVRRELRRIN